MAASRKKENPLQSAVENILKRQGKNYETWKKEIIDSRKLMIMSDSDKEWLNQTIEEASFKVIVEDLATSSQTTNTQMNNGGN